MPDEALAEASAVECDAASDGEAESSGDESWEDEDAWAAEYERLEEIRRLRTRERLRQLFERLGPEEIKRLLLAHVRQCSGVNCLTCQKLRERCARYPDRPAAGPGPRPARPPRSRPARAPPALTGRHDRTPPLAGSKSTRRAGTGH